MALFGFGKKKETGGDFSIYEFMDSVDDILTKALQSGKKVQAFTVEPKYKEKSIVPSSIYIKADGDISIEETINVW